jgi:lipoyl(octanoyl) transferase
MGEHPIIVTQGVRARKIAGPSDIPLCQSSRGGMLSLHLPGQLVFYPLYRFDTRFDISRYVWLLEQMILDYLALWQITGYRCLGAPGVYTCYGKIASLGLRVRQHAVIHGLSFNISCPLQPFERLENCGQKNLPITHLAAHQIFPMLSSVKTILPEMFLQLLKQEWA